MNEQKTEVSGTLADCVATPDEMVRTALRLLVTSMHRGLYRAPPRIRKSTEATRAAQAIFALSDFLVHRYDRAQLEDELRRLSGTLVPLAVIHGCDPFYLSMLATGAIRHRRKGAARPLHR